MKTSYDHAAELLDKVFGDPPAPTEIEQRDLDAYRAVGCDSSGCYDLDSLPYTSRMDEFVRLTGEVVDDATRRSAYLRLRSMRCRGMIQ